MSDVSLLLIVRQRPAPHADLEDLLDELQSGFGFDPYTTRQRLLGPGLAQLAQGEKSELDGLSGSLRRHGYTCWVVDQPRPAFVPPRLRNLSIGTDAVEFYCEKEQRVRLERGLAVVGVLADLSGELAGRQVKRLLTQNAYLGREQATPFTLEETRQAIYKGQPVFDCYLLDGEGTVTAAFRVLPGRFNPEGLGERAGLSVARNFEAIVKLVGEYAGTYRLHTDFGLSQLPGCLPQPMGEDSATATTENLNALTRYGWLVTRLSEPAVAREGEATVSSGAVLTAGIGGVTTLAGTTVATETLRTFADEVDAAAAEQLESAKMVVPPLLPPPPERPEHFDQEFSLFRVLLTVCAILGGLLLTVNVQAISDALNNGLLAAVAAVGLCWKGFVYLQLKRRIEDTPTSRIRSLAMGLVEVQGRAVRRYALVAPMTQSACVWYRIRKYQREEKNVWMLRSQSDSNHVPFILDDGSSQVVVDPAGATIKAKTQEISYPGTNKCQISSAGPDEKWVEELIYEGTTLYVLGYARPAREVGPGLRGRTTEMLRRLKLDPHARRRYDTNGDSRLDADEWQAARADAERLAAAEHLEEQRRPAVDNVLLGKPPRGLPFLIAEGQADGELAGRYGWFAAALLALGVAAFLLTLKLALAYFRLLQEV